MIVELESFGPSRLSQYGSFKIWRGWVENDKKISKIIILLLGILIFLSYIGMAQSTNEKIIINPEKEFTDAFKKLGADVTGEQSYPNPVLINKLPDELIYCRLIKISLQLNK